MTAKLVGLDSAEGNSALQLDSKEIVMLTGGRVDQYIYLCHALKKNILGIPIKKVWHFYIFDVDGKYADKHSWYIKVNKGVQLLGEKNLVFMNFSTYSPLASLIGYAMGFPSLASMHKAQDHHSELFDPEKAAEAAMSAGLLKPNWRDIR